MNTSLPNHYSYIGRRGFTLIELMLVLGIIAILSSIAMPLYQGVIENSKNNEAILDINEIKDALDNFVLENGAYPLSLADLAGINLDDPWGNPYQYLNFDTVKGKGKMRKDRFMVPINTYYDLYSMGKDGKSSTPLTAKSSRDDIICANDGVFIGLANDY